MRPDRRVLLAGLAGVGGLTALANAAGAVETPLKPPLPDRLAAEAIKHRLPIAFDGDAVSGPGLDRLVEEGRAARFFLVGEEHGVAQIPALVGRLMTALAPVGYSRLGLEVSPPAAEALDRAARGGIGGLKRLYAEYPPGPAFYTMAEEARMLATVRAAVPGKAPVLCGFDYEVLVDRMLIDGLKARAPASARAPLAALDAASRETWARYETTRDLNGVFPFSGDPALVRAVRAAWPKPDAASAEILEALEQTLIINQHRTEKRWFQSNDSRARFNRANWARFWRVEGARASPPKVMLKFGAGHMVRGRSMTEVYDIGGLVAETAALRGEESFHLLIVPLNGRQAVLNPATLTYGDAAVSTIEELALEPLAAAAITGVSTLIDLRPLRPLMSASVTRTADPRLTRVVHGYDAVLLVRNARASGNL